MICTGMLISCFLLALPDFFQFFCGYQGGDWDYGDVVFSKGIDAGGCDDEPWGGFVYAAAVVYWEGAF